MITRTSMPQSIGTVLDGMKRNALQAVRQTMQENRLQSVPMGIDVRMGWTDEDGRTRCGTVTGLNLDGERLKVQVRDHSLTFVLDEQQLPCGSHIWLTQVTMPSETPWRGKSRPLDFSERMGCQWVSHHTCAQSFYKIFSNPCFSCLSSCFGNVSTPLQHPSIRGRWNCGFGNRWISKCPRWYSRICTCLPPVSSFPFDRMQPGKAL